ncbi:MAG: hypothetical protein D3910_20890 [Candidatus Electrothrix sp. ATG2]|nr:hypothetical protein [Candidatus Electrothrix sp. ATG2]
MQAIDNEFSGAGSSGWITVAQVLYKRKMISWQHFFDIAVYWGFGRLINNTDMHLGNISFSIDGGGFGLAPMYDMCSMGFSPRSSEENPPFSFSPPDIDNHLVLIKEAVPTIKVLARVFWDTLGENELISDDLKKFLKQGNPIDKL